MSDGDDPALGATDKGAAIDVVTIQVTGEGAAQLRTFLTKMATLCNSGCSRSVIVTDNPKVDPDSGNLRWDFDGDGNTRLKIVDD